MTRGDQRERRTYGGAVAVAWRLPMIAWAPAFYVLFGRLGSLVPHACAHTVEAYFVAGGAVTVKSCIAARGDSTGGLPHSKG